MQIYMFGEFLLRNFIKFHLFWAFLPNSVILLFQYMLYKLRNQNHQHPNKGDHWEFTALFEAEIKIVSKWKKLEDEGKTRGEFLVSIEEELAQAEWLDKEHRTMLDQLKHENEKFKQEFEG